MDGDDQLDGGGHRRSGIAEGASEILRVSDGKYWDGSGFNATRATWLDATGTSSWCNPLAVANLEQCHDVHGRREAVDNANNVQPAAAAASFSYDTTAPTVTINQAAGQADPTNASPINFMVVFSQAVTDFATGDVTLGGTAGATNGHGDRQRHDVQRGGERDDGKRHGDCQPSRGRGA